MFLRTELSDTFGYTSPTTERLDWGEPGQGGCGCEGCGECENKGNLWSAFGYLNGATPVDALLHMGQSENTIAKSPVDCFTYCSQVPLEDFLSCLIECQDEASDYNLPNNKMPKYDMNIPCGLSFDKIALPDFNTIHDITQDCFYLDYKVKDWLHTSCCAPELNAKSSCSQPSYVNWLKTHDALEPSLNDSLGTYQLSPTSTDKQIFNGGFSILMENWDLAEWAACLVGEWSVEISTLGIVERLRQLLVRNGDGDLPLTVTYVNAASNSATMWAYTYGNEKLLRNGQHKGVGFIVPINYTDSNLRTTPWGNRINAWQQGKRKAFCAAVQTASEILHEMVHIVGDNFDNGTRDFLIAGAVIDEPGTLHDYYINEITGEMYNAYMTCWDEARMIATIFIYAMTKRYDCLAQDCCANMSDPQYVAYSGPTSDQISTGC